MIRVVTRFKTRDSYLLKLRRAKEHRDEVVRLANQHLEVKPTTRNLECEIDATTGQVVVCCPELDFDPSIFLAAADCLANVRACLDHLVCQIALGYGVVDVTKQAFPISDRLDDFNDSIGKGALKGVPFEAITIIESHQPYDRTTGVRIDSHPLFILRELTNTDKHRAVYFASPDVHDLQITVYAGGQESTVNAAGPFRPGRTALVGTLSFVPSGPPVTVRFRGVNRITFEQFPVLGQVVTKVLTGIIDFVEMDVIPGLKRFADVPT